MAKMKKTSVAIAAIVTSTHAFSFELGEFNNTKFSFSGYIKGEGVIKSPDAGDSNFDASARQTRFGFGTEKNMDGKNVKMFIEGDFYGGGVAATTYDWRLRHAYVKVDGLTIGQTWNGQFLSTVAVAPEMISFFGSGFGTLGGGGAVVRPDVVLRYQHGGFQYTLQDPADQDADFPDFVAAYSKRFKEGHAFNLAVSGRQLNAPDGDKDFGYGAEFASKYSLGNTTLHLSGFYSKGESIYSGYGYNGARGKATSEYDAAGDLIDSTGFVAGIRHTFSDKLRGNIRYGQINLSDSDASVEDTAKMTNVNLIYKYLPNLEFGVEWRDQNVFTHPKLAAGQQIEFMSKYYF